MERIKPPGREPLELRPLPLRIPQITYDRLLKLRAMDTLTIQEHVRRGLEYYLDHVEASIALRASDLMALAIEVVKENHEPGPDMVPGLLAKHAPMPRRTPKVVAK